MTDDDDTFMGRPLYYARDGRPLDRLSWAQMIESRDPAVLVVAQHDVGDVRVSTVWLGLDHSLGRGAPMIFETMVFGGQLDQETERYSTEAQAWEGHAVMCGRVRAAIGEPVEIVAVEL